MPGGGPFSGRPGLTQRARMGPWLAWSRRATLNKRGVDLMLPLLEHGPCRGRAFLRDAQHRGPQGAAARAGRGGFRRRRPFFLGVFIFGPWPSLFPVPRSAYCKHTSHSVRTDFPIRRPARSKARRLPGNENGGRRGCVHHLPRHESAAHPIRLRVPRRQRARAHRLPRASRGVTAGAARK